MIKPKTPNRINKLGGPASLTSVRQGKSEIAHVPRDVPSPSGALLAGVNSNIKAGGACARSHGGLHVPTYLLDQLRRKRLLNINPWKKVFAGVLVPLVRRLSKRKED